MMPAPATPPTSAIARRRDLPNSRDGTVALMFGLLLLPTLAAVGVGFDVARAYSAKMRFDAAFDNAAFTLRASPATATAASLRERMQGYLDLANPSPAFGGVVTLRMSDPLKRVVTVTASAAVPTALMQLAGVQTLPLHATAQIVRQHPPGSEAAPGDGGDDRGGNWEERRRQMQRGAQRGLWLREDCCN